jgi:hypothetical protein
MYGRPPGTIPIVIGGGAIPITGFKGLIIAEIAIVLILCGLILLRLIKIRRLHAPD